ncbi:MAG: hypothetical protein LBI37_03630 [Puniceicoccales bacterium]|jgi:hypothetical protein|nr:hypothetical protein [Puniceicoccales bacterium]
MKISFGSMVLAAGNDAKENPFDLKIFGQRNVQIAETVRGTEAKAIDRGNLQITIEFKVSKKYDSVESAQIHSLKHSSELTGLQSYLTLIGEPSNTTYYMHNAVLVTVQSSASGNTSLHYYKITGGRITNNMEFLYDNNK